MEHHFAVDVEAPADRLFDIVADLSTYRHWLDIVHRVDTDSERDEKAWQITLRAKLGPLARSKRLRMVRTVHETPHRVRFERHEHDGRAHSSWILDATITGNSAASSPLAGTHLAMALTYGGRLWTSALNPILNAQVANATSNLEALCHRADGEP